MNSSDTAVRSARAKSAMNITAPLRTPTSSTSPAGVLLVDGGSQLGDLGGDLLLGDQHPLDLRRHVVGRSCAAGVTAALTRWRLAAARQRLQPPGAPLDPHPRRQRDGALAVPVLDQRPQGVDVRGAHGAGASLRCPPLQRPGAQRRGEQGQLGAVGLSRKVGGEGVEGVGVLPQLRRGAAQPGDAGPSSPRARAARAAPAPR
jgi:hypothetical protein